MRLPFHLMRRRRNTRKAVSADQTDELLTKKADVGVSRQYG